MRLRALVFGHQEFELDASAFDVERFLTRGSRSWITPSSSSCRLRSLPSGRGHSKRDFNRVQ
jgi:hypothetical protein